MAKQKSPFKVFLVNRRPCTSLVVPSSSSKETTISGSILFLTSALAAVLPLIPYENTGRHRVPKIIFKGQSSTFHAFIISIMFAFSGAFSGLFVYDKPLMARLCRFYSMVSMVCAGALLISASFAKTS
ncbi:CTP synthase [Actinidia chinensis var. chinensis]|uniref:CTP synthase n=1 Tax=Actinidia chinensis var. chinensis TaxID=1590841 RepID=A0A2R6PB24_ACTCC|nr:CTP synthase [Actinidia chinensis var. chinensis]